MSGIDDGIVKIRSSACSRVFQSAVGDIVVVVAMNEGRVCDALCR